MKPLNCLLVCICLLVCFGAHGQIITTVAGNGVAGYNGEGGLATNANISYPIGLAIDNVGNILVGLSQSFPLVRKIDKTSNIIRTIAGSDTASSAGGGGDGGIATCASVLSVYAIATDAMNNFYIADFGHNEVRKVDVLTGIIDTFAGCRIIGNTGDGGFARQAKFNSISGICIDTVSGYLYIADGYNHRVRRVNMATGIITAFAGSGINGYGGDNGPASSAKFSRVLGLSLDRFGNIYVGDWDNARIRKIDAVTGIVTTIAGNGTVGYSGDDGLATLAMLAKPSAIRFDHCGNLYFSDEDNNRVRKVDVNTGIITTIAGSGVAGYGGDGGQATAAQFNHPTGLAIDDSGNLFISDYYNQRIRKVSFNPNCWPLAVGDAQQNKSLAIYPNPATSTLHIDNLKAPATYTLYDITGRVVATSQLTTGPNELNTTHLSPGIYLLHLLHKDGTREVHKIVKE